MMAHRGRTVRESRSSSDSAEATTGRSHLERSGLTMIELLVTLAVALTISVVGVQIFSSVIDRTKVGDAQRSLERAIFAQSSYAATNDGYATSSDELDEVTTGRGLSLSAGVSTSNTVVSVAELDGGSIALAVFVDEGRCLGVTLGDPYSDGEVGTATEFDGICSADVVGTL